MKGLRLNSDRAETIHQTLMRFLTMKGLRPYAVEHVLDLATSNEIPGNEGIETRT